VLFRRAEALRSLPEARTALRQASLVIVLFLK
jgi:hypothetical protein